jgi:SAM-dependent methyltransferase
MPERVDKARARGIEAYQGDLNKELPYQDESFDVVHANQVIEHLHNTDILLKEVYRVLKAGGYLVISTPNLASFHNILHLLMGKQPFWASVSDEVNAGTWHLVGPANKASKRPGFGPGHRRLFTQGALEELLEYYGFKIEKSISTGFYPFPAPIARVMSLIDRRHAAIITVKARKPAKL